MDISVIGQGYVGLNLAMGASEVGHNVVGIDINRILVDQLNRGESHIEGIANTTLVSAIKRGKYRASTNFSEISNAEVVVIAVPTPLDSSGLPDISLLSVAVSEIAPHLRHDALVVSESTSFIGTLRELIAKQVMIVNKEVKDFAVSPERVDPGNRTFNLRNTPRIVGGISQTSVERATKFYSTFCDKVVKVESPEIAEAAKLLENSFRFINIGFINEFTQILSAMNIPATDVISAAATKPYGFMPFFPNVGIGGHCIPVDPLYFQKNAHDFQMNSRYIALSEELNHEMPHYFIDRLEGLIGSLNDKHVLVVGVTYKPDIADTRESPAESVLKILKSKSAKVAWHDPLVNTFEGESSSPITGNYDLALVLVKHQQLDMSEWNGKPVYCVNPVPSEPDWTPLLSLRSGLKF